MDEENKGSSPCIDEDQDTGIDRIYINIGGGSITVLVHVGE